tara:strand:+ start:135 stop:731 length:597 start_codon:yes stop_codon:yes gene_type:complete
MTKTTKTNAQSVQLNKTREAIKNASNDIEKVQKLFISNMGNGKVAAKHLHTLICDGIKTGDSRQLAKSLTTLTKNADKAGLTATRSIILSIIPASTAKNSKDKKSIVLNFNAKKNKLPVIDAKALARLVEGIKDGLSIRATLAAIVANKQVDAFQYDVFLGKVSTKLIKEGVSKAKALATFEAKYDEMTKEIAEKAKS